MESCTAVTFAIALDCFTSANYTSKTLKASRVASMVAKLTSEANGQDLARFLYRCEAFGVREPALLKNLA